MFCVGFVSLGSWSEEKGKRNLGPGHLAFVPPNSRDKKTEDKRGKASPIEQEKQDSKKLALPSCPLFGVWWL